MIYLVGPSIFIVRYSFVELPLMDVRNSLDVNQINVRLRQGGPDSD